MNNIRILVFCNVILLVQGFKKLKSDSFKSLNLETYLEFGVTLTLRIKRWPSSFSPFKTFPSFLIPESDHPYILQATFEVKKGLFEKEGDVGGGWETRWEEQGSKGLRPSGAHASITTFFSSELNCSSSSASLSSKAKFYSLYYF